MLDKKGMEKRAGESVQDLGIQTIQNMSQAVETLSGGQRQAVAVARAAAFGSKVVVLDEPTAALGVKESGMVLDMVKQLRDKGLSIILISHNMPHVWEVADRIHIQRLGGRAGVITPQTHDMGEGVAIMTGAEAPRRASLVRPRDDRRRLHPDARRDRGLRAGQGRGACSRLAAGGRQHRSARQLRALDVRHGRRTSTRIDVELTAAGIDHEVHQATDGLAPAEEILRVADRAAARRSSSSGSAAGPRSASCSLGSTAQQVLLDAACPVLAVKPR